MAKEKIGSSISSELHTQITKREAFHGSGLGSQRSKAALEYLNSNNCWIKLRSSVNTISETTAEQILKGLTPCKSGDEYTAKQLILTGGTLKDNDMRAGVGFQSNTRDGSTAYHKSKITGFKPMPGITGLTVKAKNTFGTLKEANVKIKVFSREDLDDMETLYFRIGYSMLLEYGHTVYVNNEGKVKTATTANSVSNNIFFSDNASEDILKEIKSNRANTDGNYDALLGFVSNFNWTLQSDGTYDCSVDIISKGIILEGLMNSQVSTHATADEQKNDEEEQGMSEAQSNISYISERIGKNKKTTGTLKELLKEANSPSIASALAEDHKVIGAKFSVGPGGNLFMRFLQNKSVFVSYISIGALLDILNTFELMKDNVGNVICGFDIQSDEKYRTFPAHYTTNPLSVILPKKCQGNFSFANASIVKPESKLVENAQSAYAGKETYCTSIMVSTYMLDAKMKELIDGPKDKGTGIFDFIKSVLAQINYDLGGINNLDLHYDDDTHIYTVIDRGTPRSNKTRPREIKVSGLSTTVTDISVVSEISSEMKSMVSIAAQGNTGNYNDDLSNMLKFNKGCIDRHHWSKGQNDTGNKEAAKTTADKDVEPFIERFKKAWDNFNKKEVVNPEYWSDLHGEAASNLNRSYQLKAASKGDSSQIPVPIKLNLSLKGISGFKIGSTFTVNTDIIPTKYGRFGYYVMGVDHTCDSGGWTTNVSAYLRNL